MRRDYNIVRTGFVRRRYHAEVSTDWLHSCDCLMYLGDKVFELEKRLVLSERVLLLLHLDQLLEIVFSAANDAFDRLFLHLVECILFSLAVIIQDLIDISCRIDIKCIINQITH